MNDTMRTGMADATRLMRAGQLIEATALIQRMLRDMRAPDASSHTADEPVDVPFRVFDTAPLSPEAARQGPDQQRHTGAVITLPPPDVAVSPHESGSAPPSGPTPEQTLVRTSTAGHLRPSSLRVGASLPNSRRWSPNGLLACALRFAHLTVDLVGQYPYPCRSGHTARFVQGDSLSRDPIPTMPEPAPISYTSPVAIAGKLCLWSLCSMAVRRPQRISPLAPV
jgi:hypothetical protein